MPFLQEYTMLDELGSGGFATVYKVRHNELGYIRAVRMLKENIATKEGDDPQKTPTYQKFLRECKVLLRLGNGNHPNIVHIYQPRLLDNKALVEMDYVDGFDIQHYLKQNQCFVPAEEVIRMALQMSSALSYCHEDIYRFCMDREADKLKDDPNDGSKVLMDDQTRKRLIEKYKVIHNDIHSGNIMRREDGNFVLLDFGLAINGNEVVRSSRRKNGAPEFKAPEKWDDELILTEQSDIYSFGVVLYQYLAGRVPFPFNTKNSNKTEAEYLLSKAHQNATPPSLELLRKDSFEKKNLGQEYKKDYPQWLEDVIFKCLNKNPKDRFRNGKELYDCVKKHVLEETKSSKEVENKLVELTIRNKTLETEVGGLQDANASLNTALNEKQNNLVRTEQLLRETNEQTDTLKQEKQSLQKELERLKREGTSGAGKWKVFAFVLLFALLACSALLGYCYVKYVHLKLQPIENPSIQHLRLDFPVSEKNTDLTFTVEDVTFKMVYVDGGTFTMGCTSEQGGNCEGDESPSHQVTLNSFYMGETEVTQELYEAVMGVNPSNWKAFDRPVESVSWNDAMEFCAELSRMTGRRFTLPTEAEWEYAARGGIKSTNAKYSGSSSVTNVAWYDGNSGNHTHPVGKLRPNELGIYDMSGNVWEWCLDWKGSYSSASQTDPTGPGSGSYRVLRGGSWYGHARGCRVSRRNGYAPGARYNGYGFRVVLH